MNDFSQHTVSFDKVISALLDITHPFQPVHLHRFSDLSNSDLQLLMTAWEKIDPNRRVSLLEDLEDLADADTLVSFDDLGKFALNDPNPRVREIALRLLWECDDPALVSKFIQMVDTDPDQKVRSAAATALGQFIYIGELEEIPESILHRIENKLLDLTNNEAETKLLRRRALEALGFSSRPELKDLIRAAYSKDDHEWLVSSIFAMGRSANSTWIPFVLDMLDSENEEVLFETVRAAGELEAAAARKPIMKIVKSQPAGSEVRMAGIWALSKIGGEKVRDTLEDLLERSEDEDEIDLLEDALENLEFTEGFNKFGLLDYEPEDEDKLIHMALEEEMDEDIEDEDDLDEDEYFEDDEISPKS